MMKNLLQTIFFSLILGSVFYGCGGQGAGVPPINDLRDFKRPTTETKNILEELKTKVMKSGSFPELDLADDEILKHQTITQRQITRVKRNKCLWVFSCDRTSFETDTENEITRSYDSELGIVAGSTLGEEELTEGLKGEEYREKVRRHIHSFLSVPNITYRPRIENLGTKKIALWEVRDRSNVTLYSFSFDLPLEFNPYREEIWQRETSEDEDRWINTVIRVIIPHSFH